MTSSALIVAVRKDDKGVITHVQTTAEIGDKINSGGERTKQEIIHNITDEDVHYAVPSGAKVRVVANKYIRSVPNDTEEDNLGELPTF